MVLPENLRFSLSFSSEKDLKPPEALRAKRHPAGGIGVKRTKRCGVLQNVILYRRNTKCINFAQSQQIYPPKNFSTNCQQTHFSCEVNKLLRKSAKSPRYSLLELCIVYIWIICTNFCLFYANCNMNFCRNCTKL